MNNLVSRTIPAIALDSLDDRWHNTFQCSIIGKSWQGLLNFFAKFFRLAPAGSVLQFASFLLLTMLLLATGLPQFAGDKEGLAVFVCLATLAWVLGRLIGGKEKYTVSAVDILVIAFFLVNIVATAASHYLSSSIVGLAKVFVFILSYFIFRATLLQSRSRILILLGALLLTGFLVSLYGLYQYKIGVAPLATWEDPTVDIKGTRIFSTLGNPNLLAAYLIPMAPLSIALAFLSIKAKHWILGIILFAASSVFTVACLLTASRGAYIGLFTAAAVFALALAVKSWKEFPRARMAILVGIVVLPVLLYIALHFVPSFEQRFTSIFAGREHTSNSFRMNVWHASWKMFLDNWWFGIGPGNKTFVLAYGLYMLSGFDALGTYCVPLEIAVETGIIGLTIFLCLIMSCLSKAHLSFWKGKSSLEKWLALGCTSALLGMMAHGLVDTVFYRPQVQFIFWLLIASLTIIHSPIANSNKQLTN